MINKVVLLTHISVNDDEKILGCFSEDRLPEVIEFYSGLPGFDSSKNGFKVGDSLLCSCEYVYLLQIWNKNNDEIVYLQKLFKIKSDAINSKKMYYQCNPTQHLDYTIEKYTINKRFWAEGFFSYEYE